MNEQTDERTNEWILRLSLPHTLFLSLMACRVLSVILSVSLSLSVCVRM